jgi:hypothetical protein
MKVDSKHLDHAITKLLSTVLGYDDRDKSVSVEIAIITADPGSGSMVDCLTFKASKLTKESDKDVTMIVEVYSEDEKQNPRATKIESFPVTSKY